MIDFKNNMKPACRQYKGFGLCQGDPVIVDMAGRIIKLNSFLMFGNTSEVDVKFIPDEDVHLTFGSDVEDLKMEEVEEAKRFEQGSYPHLSTPAYDLKAILSRFGHSIDEIQEFMECLKTWKVKVVRDE